MASFVRKHLFTPQNVATAELLDAGLWSLGSIAGYYGKAIGLLLQACCQVWRVQSPFLNHAGPS